MHDFNPGIRRSGLFWTTQIRRDSVHVDVRDGQARMRVRALDMDDYFNLPNALFGDREAPATVSFGVTWCPRQAGIGSGTRSRISLACSSPRTPR